MKPTIEKELEKEFIHLYDSHKYLIAVNLAIQNTMKELKKKKYCKQCGDDNEHSISCNSITRGYVYDEKDIEKAFGCIKDGKRN